MDEQQNSGNAYLVSQVMTAAPQKLHLMLIEGAMRFVCRAKVLLGQDKNEEAGESLLRGQQVIGELLAAVRVSDNELSRQATSVYLFLFRTLTEAHLSQDTQKIQEVLRVLEIERETWKMVCEKLNSESGENPSRVNGGRDMSGSTGESGFSLEA